MVVPSARSHAYKTLAIGILSSLPREGEKPPADTTLPSMKDSRKACFLVQLVSAHVSNPSLVPYCNSCVESFRCTKLSLVTDECDLPKSEVYIDEVVQVILLRVQMFANQPYK